MLFNISGKLSLINCYFKSSQGKSSKFLMPSSFSSTITAFSGKFSSSMKTWFSFKIKLELSQYLWTLFLHFNLYHILHSSAGKPWVYLLIKHENMALSADGVIYGQEKGQGERIQITEIFSWLKWSNNLQGFNNLLNWIQHRNSQRTSSHRDYLHRSSSQFHHFLHHSRNSRNSFSGAFIS